MNCRGARVFCILQPAVNEEILAGVQGCNDPDAKHEEPDERQCFARAVTWKYHYVVNRRSENCMHQFRCNKRMYKSRSGILVWIMSFLSNLAILRLLNTQSSHVTTFPNENL